MTKDQPKRVPFPRAKMGDIVVVQERQFQVVESCMNPYEYIWGYIAIENLQKSCLSVSLLDANITFNLTTGIDYQDEEKKGFATLIAVDQPTRPTHLDGVRVNVRPKEECKHKWCIRFSGDGLEKKVCRVCLEEDPGYIPKGRVDSSNS